MKKVVVSVASLNQTPGLLAQNRANILKASQLAQKAGASLLVTPELSLSGYGLEDYFHSPKMIENCFTHLLKLAEELPEDLVVTVGVPYLFSGRLYNAAAVLLNGRIQGLTFKKNLASNGIHYEQRWFTQWQSNEVFRDRPAGFDYEIPVGTPIFDISGLRFGIEICEDGWVSNRVASHYFNCGVDIIANPSASHFAIGKFATRQRLVQDSSRAHGVTYLYCNLNGCESGRAVYDGGCLICSDGEVVNQGERFHFTDVEITTSAITNNLSRISKFTASQRYSEMPTDTSEIVVPVRFKNDPVKDTNQYTAEKRPQPLLDTPKNRILTWESSENLEHEEAVRAIALGLRDWSKKTFTGGYALSLSGGADSALVSVLCYLSMHYEISEFKRKGIDLAQSYFNRFVDDIASADAHDIMKKYLTTGYQPSRNSGSVTRTAAYELARSLGADHYIFEVGDIVEAYENELSKNMGIKFNWEEHDIFKQNIQARTRSPMIWGVANVKNALLLTTSNLSEASVGYVTQDGDSSGVLAPISGVTKSRVLRILQWLETDGTTVSHEDSSAPFKFEKLSYINEQRPTAELRPVEQTDEDDLMPFSLLDKIIELHIQQNHSPVEIFEELICLNKDKSESYLAECIVKYFRFFHRNQWKRDRQAPGFHIEINSLDPKTYKRMPLLGTGFHGELELLQKYIN
ncbi:NAD(+) synthase [Vibrio hannami]|uniref:NAD(+) synthase n=1 Tax=Vibrio hannami TaxID=2717094 RepID=UPI002410975B|nr:NAD(+) synthase [Vibrio hannami]MDG3085690.1 NAD(+) synthase [Vibrio hannami]